MPRRARSVAQERPGGAQDARERPRRGKVALGATTRAVEPLSAIYAAMSEREFQRIVVGHLRSRGWLVWHVPNMKQTTAGLPDLFCIHTGYPLVLLWELKGEKTRVTPIQRAVIETLMSVPGVDARIVRPSGWEQLRDVLDSGRLLELHAAAAREIAPRPAAGAGGE